MIFVLLTQFFWGKVRSILKNQIFLQALFKKSNLSKFKI